MANSPSDKGNESVASANGLLKIICRFEFLITFAVARAVFAHTKGMSVLLQSRSRKIISDAAVVHCEFDVMMLFVISFGTHY